MLIIIKFAAKILSILNGEESSNQIAAGAAFGALIGLIPIGGLLPYLLLLIAFLININLTAVFVFAALFKIVSFGIDPLANQLGFLFLVQFEFLKGLWTAFASSPLIPYTKFNNTLVLGSFLTGLILFAPLFLLSRQFVNLFRTKWRDGFNKLKIVQIVKASSFFRYYESYRRFRGD